MNIRRNGATRVDPEVPGKFKTIKGINTAESESMKEVFIPPGTDLNKIGIEHKLFNIRTANQCLADAKNRQIPKRLHGDLWFEGELCIAFGDTGTGKSIVAVQIADGISSGKGYLGITCEAEKQRVLYFDFELFDKQFENRYSNNYKDHYLFDDHFLRVEINPEAEMPEGFKDFDEYLIDSIEETIKTTGSKVIIIDNITYLKNEQDKAKNALPLMQELNRIKKQYKISMLVLAHTPKRDSFRPITENDIQGSKMLSNFCDSIFAIGKSSIDLSIRYVKQIKQRNVENKYGEDNVMVFKLAKPENFLYFEFIGFSSEAEHLGRPNEMEKSELENRVKNMLHTEKDLSAYAIAKRIYRGEEQKFKSFHVKIDRLVKRLHKKGD